MKKILLWTAVIAFSIIAVSILYTTVRYNSFSPPDPETAADSGALAYYPDSYSSSRRSFREKAGALAARFRGVEMTRIPVPSKVEADLTVDVCYIPAQETAKRLLILSSGVHGVEAFTGSAILRMFMDELVTARNVSENGIMLIHAMNPYGFKHVRRVTENNVDLNRNCDTNPSLFSSVNEGYAEVYGLINPKGKADTQSMRNLFFHIVAVREILSKSMKTLRQAILQGQYQFPEGLYFGGKELEPQVKSMIPVFQAALARYPVAANIDLHTGYGQRGVCHLFPNPVKDPEVRKGLERLFAGYAIDWGDGDDFYTVSGLFSDFIGTLSPEVFYLPMAFEYGTMNSQTTMGSIRSLQVTLLENQGVQFGYDSPEVERRIKDAFKEMYNPSSPAWRTKVMQDSRKLFEVFMERFNGFER